MRDVRLIPLLAFAAAALLGLKTVGLIADGRFALSGPAPATAQTPDPPAEPERVADAPVTVNAETGAGPATLPGATRSERAVLERLGERREQLEARQRELEMRENLLRAAEKRIEERIDELKAIEARIGAAADEIDDARAAELDAIVSMYESMKPKDAARIFDQLDLAVLVDIARNMRPRKMAEIVAAMSPDLAQRLTIELTGPRSDADTPARSALPKIGEDPL